MECSEGRQVLAHSAATDCREVDGLALAVGGVFHPEESEYLQKQMHMPLVVHLYLLVVVVAYP